MLQNEQNRARTSWVRRIVILLRTAEVWQLREIFYMVSGYIGASRGAGRGKDRDGRGGNACDRVQ